MAPESSPGSLNSKDMEDLEREAAATGEYESGFERPDNPGKTPNMASFRSEVYEHMEKLALAGTNNLYTLEERLEERRREDREFFKSLFDELKTGQGVSHTPPSFPPTNPPRPAPSPPTYAPPPHRSPAQPYYPPLTPLATVPEQYDPSQLSQASIPSPHPDPATSARLPSYDHVRPGRNSLPSQDEVKNLDYLDGRRLNYFALTTPLVEIRTIFPQLISERDLQDQDMRNISRN